MLWYVFHWDVFLLCYSNKTLYLNASDSYLHLYHVVKVVGYSCSFEDPSVVFGCVFARRSGCCLFDTFHNPILKFMLFMFIRTYKYKYWLEPFKLKCWSILFMTTQTYICMLSVKNHILTIIPCRPGSSMHCPLIAPPTLFILQICTCLYDN